METSPSIAPDLETPPDTLSSRQPDVIPAKAAPARFDFRQPAFLPPAEMRNLRRQHAEYIESLTACLSNYLRAEVSFEITKLDTLTYRDFVASIKTPVHLTLLKAEPLRGICVVSVHPKMGLAIVDRLLGGPGVPLEESRDLSEIETALLDEVIQLIITEWCNLWEKGKAIRPLALAHENGGRFLQTSSPDTTMLVLALEARIGECTEQIQAVFPWPMIEPLLGELAPKLVAETPAQSRESNRPKWRSEFADIPMRVTAQGPALEIPARDLAELQLGDLLGLDPQFANHITLSVGQIAKFTGRLGTSDGKWAIEITAVQNI